MISVTASVKTRNTKQAKEMLMRAAFRHNVEEAKEIVTLARALCPVSDSNEAGHTHLRDTIRAEADEGRAEVRIVAGDAEKGVNHAVVVEFGGVRTAPHPYLTPAIEQRRGRTFRG